MLYLSLDMPPHAVFSVQAHGSALRNIYCILRGRIKDRNSTLSAIKFQVCCIKNTARWLANTVQLR